MKRIVTPSLLALLVIAGAAWVRAQDPPAPAGDMPMGCRGMMASGPSSASAASEKKLDDLLATMKAATGEKKVEAMAEVIDMLVAEHKANAQIMAGTMPAGGGCMMKMQAGGGCTMMKMQGATADGGGAGGGGCCCKGGVCPMMKGKDGEKSM